MTAAARAPSSPDRPTRAEPGSVRRPLLAAWQRLEHALDGLTGSGLNPLRHLGSLGFLCFWALALSGIYLFAVIDTSASGAHRSIERLAQLNWFYGGWLRGVHRYAADAFVLLMGAHLVREWLHGRYAGFRRFSWLTGVPLIVFAFVCAIGGFWLNWDQLGQYSAIATAEWLDALPLLGAPLARNFLTADAVSDRLFSLFVFVHLGVSLLTLFALWFHIQRLTRARVLPPLPLAVGALTMLVLLATLLPVVSGEAADVAVMPAELRFDWLLLFLHPLVRATSGEFVWFLVGGALLFLLALPFVSRSRVAAPVALVEPAHCSGCRRCFDDCPYAAISMVAHPNGKPGVELALVHAERCASCGICAGSCPSSTPFRSMQQLVTGIDMPQLPVDALRQRMRAGLAGCGADRPIVVFGCAHGPRVNALRAPDVVPMELICAGQMPPSFVEYALRDGAAGVLVTGCAEGACAYRHGQAFAHERLLGRREPHLRASVPAARWAVAWADARDERALASALQALRARMETVEEGANPVAEVCA